MLPEADEILKQHCLQVKRTFILTNNATRFTHAKMRHPQSRFSHWGYRITTWAKRLELFVNIKCVFYL